MRIYSDTKVSEFSSPETESRPMPHPVQAGQRHGESEGGDGQDCGKILLKRMISGFYRKLFRKTAEIIV